MKKKNVPKEFGQVILLFVVFYGFFPLFYEKYCGLVFVAIAFFFWFPDYIKLKRGILSEERKLYYLESSYIKTDMLNTYLKGVGIIQFIVAVNLLTYYKLSAIMEIPKVIEIVWFGIVSILLIIYFKVLDIKCKSN